MIREVQQKLKISMTKKNSLFLFLFVYTTILFSQGLVENPLTTNHVLISKWNELQASPALRTPSVYDTLGLGTKGILDDFSYDRTYPDTALWLDNYVFINRGYGKAPITLGVATFDGLNEKGYPYSFIATPTSSGQADYLTSKPIHLNLPASDSLYFSFYYQPQGLGNAPETNDSLVLEFRGTGTWKHVWAKKGTTLALNDSSWTLVMIPIKDTAFLKDGFQFRFRNQATLSGNLDHWNVDYVYLNKNRNRADIIFKKELSFVYNTPSLIYTYTAKPWKHYSVADMKTVYSTTIRNNDTAVINGNFNYIIYDDLGNQVNTTYTGGGWNIDPYITSGYLNHASFTSPSLNYTIPNLTFAGSKQYTIECTINTPNDFHTENDTVRHTQVFSNYYSYDDGSAETAFGLSTLNGQMAEKYTSTVADTLRYIDIYFNPIMSNANLYTFLLNVWSDNSGTPGTAIFTSDTTLYPDYTQTGQNQFIRYFLKQPLYLSASTFYIGFTQKTNQFLNVGVDKNINTQSKTFYNVTGTWITSPNTGSLMMHPVFGSAADFVGVNSVQKEKSVITIYPNPANDKLFIKSNAINQDQKISYFILDVFGRTILESKSDISESIDISALSDGIYFIRIVEGLNISTNKFIKVK